MALLLGKLPKTESKTMVLLIRRGKPRSKYFNAVCFGPKRHYRKDGSCAHTRELMESVKPEFRDRVKLDPFGGGKYR